MGKSHPPPSASIAASVSDVERLRFSCTSKQTKDFGFETVENHPKDDRNSMENRTPTRIPNACSISRNLL